MGLWDDGTPRRVAGSPASSLPTPPVRLGRPATRRAVSRHLPTLLRTDAQRPANSTPDTSQPLNVFIDQMRIIFRTNIPSNHFFRQLHTLLRGVSTQLRTRRL